MIKWWCHVEYSHSIVLNNSRSTNLSPSRLQGDRTRHVTICRILNAHIHCSLVSYQFAGEALSPLYGRVHREQRYDKISLLFTLITVTVISWLVAMAAADAKAPGWMAIISKLGSGSAGTINAVFRILIISSWSGSKHTKHVVHV